MHKWPLTPSPILSERTRCVASHITYDKNSPVFEKVSHANVDTWVDVLFIHEHSLNDLLGYSLGNPGLVFA